MKIHDKYLQREGIHTRGGAMAKQPGHYYLDKETLQHHLNHGSYSIISAANPGANKMSDKENSERHANLQRDLANLGGIYHEVQGVYGGHSEPSIMVHHRGKVTPAAIEGLGAKYGQESVFHSNANSHELKYVTGPQAGSHHKGSGHEFGQHFEDNFTEAPGAGKFSGNLDFDKVHKSAHKELQHYIIPLAYGGKAKVKHLVNHNHFY